jgi:hypothetical protein
MEQRSQAVQLIGSANSVDLNAPVIVIAHPARDTDLPGVLLDKPAESDPLHAAGHKPTPRRLRGTIP